MERIARAPVKLAGDRAEGGGAPGLEHVDDPQILGDAVPEQGRDGRPAEAAGDVGVETTEGGAQLLGIEAERALASVVSDIDGRLFARPRREERSFDLLVPGDRVEDADRALELDQLL